MMGSTTEGERSHLNDKDGFQRKIVVDTGAYCRSSYLDKSGDAIYMTNGILAEIEKYKIKNPMESSIRLLSKPIIREPTDEDISFVKNFALLTGDLPSLSANDIECVALTRRLQIETGEIACLRTQPLPLTLKSHDKSSEGAKSKKGGKASRTDKIGFDCWIGPNNAHSYNTKSNKLKDQKVVCMTTDYAMQNVLIQMGLNVITLDGFIAKSIRRWGQLCRACYEVYPNTARQFCSKCGNATVDRVPLTIDGSTNELIAKDTRKWINNRGTIYTQPKPTTCRTKQLYIVAEDQLMMPAYKNYVRSINRKKKDDGVLHFNPDHAKLHDGPFNTSKGLPPIEDVTIGLGRGNPNSNRWVQRNKRILKSK